MASPEQLKVLDLSKEERQFIYQWFGSLLSSELTDEQIAHYQAGDFDSLFQFLAELGFHRQIDEMKTALRPQPHLRLELAADFAHCFLLEGALSAIPYLSAYLEGKALENALKEVDDWMEHYRLTVNRSHYNEPSDHISILISILIKLIESRSYQDQQQFAQNVLLSWLPQFAEKTRKPQLKTRFYPVLVELLVDFLKKDFQTG
ncbi:molecular chaperone TorD [Rodentibacter heidelbergensis]|uniref:Chaperone protein TorD n=2 Tax=Rodentibacter heidelbergensis TaxID=1908258 RepID=A0A1V3I8R6_9PAST|nr:molecular chaperone TorD [Rodentibacter heidelbergensis]